MLDPIRLMQAFSPDVRPVFLRLTVTLAALAISAPADAYTSTDKQCLLVAMGQLPLVPGLTVTGTAADQPRLVSDIEIQIDDLPADMARTKQFVGRFQSMSDADLALLKSVEGGAEKWRAAVKQIMARVIGPSLKETRLLTVSVHASNFTANLSFRCVSSAGSIEVTSLGVLE
jgi:hypothetical protein